MGDIRTNEHCLTAETRKVALAGDDVVGATKLDVNLHGDIGHVLRLTSDVGSLANVDALRGNWGRKLECRSSLDRVVEGLVELVENDHEHLRRGGFPTGRHLSLSIGKNRTTQVLHVLAHHVGIGVAVDDPRRCGGNAQAEFLKRFDLSDHELLDGLHGGTSVVKHSPCDQLVARLEEASTDQVPRAKLDSRLLRVRSIANIGG